MKVIASYSLMYWIVLPIAISLLSTVSLVSSTDNDNENQ